MSGLSNAVRQKRFKVKNLGKVSLVVETPTGKHITLLLDNCSLSGLGAYATEPLPKDEGLVMTEIMPAAKIVWQDHEEFLGRLVLRSIEPREDSRIYLGFSNVDKKVPIDGILSKALDFDPKEGTSPFEFELSPDKFNLANFIEDDQTNCDILSRCKRFHIFTREWKKSDKFLYNSERLKSKGKRFILNRKRKNGRNDFLVMGSNDYLGLAAHPRVIEAAAKAVKDYGFGSTGSPLLTGYTDLHTELCEEIAKLVKKEAALVFNSGYAANIGCLNALLTAQDIVVADILSHASIHDSLKMAASTTRYFKHNNTLHLDKCLTEHRQEFSGALVVTEGVFSMDGDIANIPEIVKTARKHNARIFLDEAHSLGVIGPSGGGIGERFKLDHEIDVVMGTLSKAFGGVGGFIAGSKDLIEWLNYYGRAFMFSTYIPPAAAAAGLEAIRVFKEDKSLVENLQRNISHFKEGLSHLGFEFSNAHESAILPVVIGDEEKLGVITQSLLNAGVFVPPIVYPAVSRSACRLRYVMMADLDVSDIDFALTTLENAIRVADFDPRRRMEEAEKAKTISLKDAA